VEITQQNSKSLALQADEPKKSVAIYRERNDIERSETLTRHDIISNHGEFYFISYILTAHTHPVNQMSSELPIIQKIYDFVKCYIPILNKLPRDHKFDLGDRIINHLYEFLEVLIQASFASLLIVGCTCTSINRVEERTTKNEIVLLLHGLARTPCSMAKLATYLSQQGEFKIINLDYPSRTQSVQQLTEYIRQQIAQASPQTAAKVHFVTHSLGGILVRAYLKTNPLKNLGQVVMLSPPNQGSELVDILKDNGLFQFIMGPAGQQLSTQPTSIPNQLGAVTFKLGIITGNVSLNPLSSFFIPGDDDGKVSVERAKIPGMTDFLVLPHSHSFIMKSHEVMRQTLYFLEHGRFDIRGLQEINYLVTTHCGHP